MKKKLFLTCALILCAFGRIVAADNAIAVPAPKTVNIDSEGAWIPLFIQGVITSNFQQYSGLTVIDRQNTDMIKAEQKLGENAVYSEEDALQLGKLTHARFIVTGNITKKTSSYALIFNITDAETGETKAAASVPNCLASALENGEAANKISYELMTGYGIKLSKDAIAALTKSAELMTSEVQAQASVAKGILAERSGSNIEALTYYVQAQKNNSKLPEAAKLMQNMTSVVSAGNFGARAKNLIQLRKDWNKLLGEAGKYVASVKPEFELRYFSDIKPGEIDYKTNSMTMAVTAPYLRQINNSEDIYLFAKKIRDAYEKIPESKDWELDIDALLYPLDNIVINESLYCNNGYIDKPHKFRINILNDKKKIIASKEVSYALILNRYTRRYIIYGYISYGAFHKERINHESGYAILYFDVPVNDADSNTYYISVTPIPNTYPLENVSILPVPEGGISIYEFKCETYPFAHKRFSVFYNQDYYYLKVKGKRTITVCGFGELCYDNSNDIKKIIAKGLTLDLSQMTNLRAAHLDDCDIAVKTLILPLSATVTSKDRETISKLLEKTKNIIYR